MSYFTIVALFVAVLSLSLTGYWLLLQKKIFQFLKKKNTGAERWASQSKPIFGGVIFYLSFLFGIVISLFLVDFSLISSKYVGVLIVCVSISFFMGLIDDLNNQGPLYKFLIQIACGIILIAAGMHIQTSDNIFINYGITILWVTGIMNSINMLDNMDGITGSVSAIILLTIIGIIGFSPTPNLFDLIILICIFASILGYMFWNWNPSKMYMGDNGSQFLGIILAIFSIQYIWNSTGNVEGINYREFLLIGLSFLLPLTDTIVVFINRLAAGKSPFVGDRNHTTHNFVYLGLTERQTAIVFIVISLLTNAAVFYIISFTDVVIHKNYYLILASIGVSISICLYILSRIVKQKNRQ
ncbi:MAG TPA: MraY family glycosyltransferase [Bacteroidales bacterium]|nr:MAG: putative undecaprenyl-phosphate N-acetylglucosaminyl 1-phosphate transferase [Bacteroidetes bacterium ADurb.Bin217]HPM12002.1 MraY family glycosyltransferase [Bacteroidales bacterium]